MCWKDFLYFQRGSKVGVLLLLILIVLTFILNVLLGFRESSEVLLVQNDSLVAEFEAFQKLLSLKENDSLFLGDAPTSNMSRRQAPQRWQPERENPSFGSHDNLLHSQAAAPHDESGGSAPATETASSVPSGNGAAPRGTYAYTQKLSEGETILLNETDTAVWKKVPGIGSVFAARIVKYRNLLGGFVSMEQLREVYGMDDALFARIAPYIEADNDFSQLAINQADFDTLARHPYLNYKQVKRIMNLRRKKGRISSIRELSLLDEFSEEDIFRLEPYLGFE